MPRTGSPTCPNCSFQKMKRLHIRETSSDYESSKHGNVTFTDRKFKQHNKPIGWYCERCFVMVPDSQIENLRARAYGKYEQQGDKMVSVFEGKYEAPFWSASRLLQEIEISSPTSEFAERIPKQEEKPKGRTCKKCGSSTTYKYKGSPKWHKEGSGFVCHKCYSKR